MARIKVKHRSPSASIKLNLLRLLAENEVYATKIIETRDGFAVITSTEKEADNLFGSDCVTALASEGFTPVLPPDQKAKRTILLFGVDDYITRHSKEEITNEIYRTNDFTTNNIEDVIRLEGKNIIKVIFSQTAPAQKSKEQGLKMFNMRVPPHQIKEQEFTPLNTCMRCYAVEEHFTNQCPKPSDYVICSECGSLEHKWFDCNIAKKECINCHGEHRTLAYKCPTRKKAAEAVKEKKKTTTHASYSRAASSQPVHAEPLFSSEAANKILTCLLQAHLMNTSEPGCFQTVLNDMLERNGLPKVVAPDNPESFKLLRPAALVPPNNTEMTEEVTSEEDDDEEDADPEVEVEEEEEETTQSRPTPNQHTKSPLPKSPRRPSPNPKKSKTKAQSPAKHPSTPRPLTPHTQDNRTQAPSSGPSNRGRPQTRPQKGLRDRLR